MNQQGTEVTLPSKKQVRKEIFEKLSGALAEYKQELGEKKLATRVKKASKLISRDLEKATRRQRQKTKKSVVPKAKRVKSANDKSAQKSDH
ncbi:MAG: hypothetical protein Q8927_16500 [Bacteroidota bacterium]|nr:hypothetical protein [Bacteroidota bacterium]MDP4217804.1 hypothetical protein [Bacteroidota bacterium]MDP4247132.1 hypothetical protein [Bacteroidota bacterium]MDP4252374.1 hypothetical protein [Bacteroidota bacterium]MDP4257931.1 hypothetical protein [Bacteroidota bacterium]